MSIYQRGPWWWMSYSANGRQIRESTKVPADGSRKGQQLAKAIHAKKLVEIAEGRGLVVKKTSRVTLKDFSQEYIERHSTPNKHPRNDIDLLTIINRHPISAMQLSEITSADIELFRSKLLNEKKFVKKLNKNIQRYQKSSVNRHVSLIKAMFNKAISWGYVEKNPASDVENFSEKLFQRERILEDSEKDKFFDAIFRPHPDRPWYNPQKLADFVNLVLHLGVRKSEILKRKWNDVDFNLRVLKTIKKGGKIHWVPLNDAALEVLKRRYVDRGRDTYILQSDLAVRPYDPTRAFQRARAMAGMPDLRPHDLRHTFASALARRGVDNGKIQALLGHDDPRMTQRYIKYNPASLLDAVQQISEPITNLSQSDSNKQKQEFESLINKEFPTT